MKMMLLNELRLRPNNKDRCEVKLSISFSKRYTIPCFRHKTIPYLIAIIIIIITTSLDTATCEPISITGPSSSSSSQNSGGPTGTWTIRAVPHQSNTGYTSTLYEVMQNLKYNWETSTEHLLRKIEMLESKIGRLETSSQLRLEKLTESVNSKEIKDELAMEQLTRKVDANYERLNHKLGYMENRLDTTLNKIQMDIESGFNRLETRQNEIDTDLTEINQSVEEIKISTAQIEERQNTTQKSIVQQNLQTIQSEAANREQIEKLTSTLQQIDTKLNDKNYQQNPQNQNQNDASGQSILDTEKIIQGLKMEIDHESHRIENKISNMYNDLWRRFMSLETTVKSTLTFGNTTRKLVQDDFRELLQQHEKQRNAEPDSQENYIEIVLDALMSTVQELTRKIESNFQMIIASQNLFMENCHRLQLEEPQLESKISLVLEKILNTITNKTMRVDNRLVETMEMIKSHQSQVMRSLGHTTKLVVTLTEANNQDAKNVESALLELAERSTIIAMAIQELQDDTEMLMNMTSVKLNDEIEDWFNKSLNENFDNEERPDKTTQEETSTEPSISTTTSTIKPFAMNTSVAMTNQSNEKINFNDKNIKYADADEVIKIFTEDEKFKDFNSDANNNTNAEKGNKKISIIIPNKYYNQLERHTNRSELYKFLIQDLLNQTGEPTEIENIDAIILNTESEKDNRKNATESIENDSSNLQLIDSNGSINSFINNQLKLSNETLEPSKNITQASDIDEPLKTNNKTNETDKLITIENKLNSTTINTKIPNIIEIMKSRLLSNKNPKKRINEMNQNNTTLRQLLQIYSNQNGNFKKKLEQISKKQKLRNQLKSPNNLSMTNETELTKNEDKQFNNKNTMQGNENEKNSEENTSTNEKNQGEKLNENSSQDEKQVEPDDKADSEDDSYFLIPGEVTISPQSNENGYAYSVYSDLKYPDGDSSSLHSTDTKDPFLHYDDSKTL